MRSIRYAALTAIVTCLSAANALATTITFETGAPSLFIQTTALRETYAFLGVHFLGSTGVNDGGAIVDQSGNFGVNALSGVDFLAFNAGATMSDGGIPRLNEIINFDALQPSVSIFMSGGFTNDALRLEGFTGLNGTGLSVAFDQHIAPSGAWSNFVVNGGGIRSVVISGPNTDGTLVADDLTFTAVPEPSSLLLMATGLGIAMRRLASRRSR